MQDLYENTNPGTMALFGIFAFFGSMLFSNLILGAIISIVLEIRSFPSARLYETLRSFSCGLPESEKRKLYEDRILINSKRVSVFLFPPESSHPATPSPFHPPRDVWS